MEIELSKYGNLKTCIKNDGMVWLWHFGVSMFWIYGIHVDGIGFIHKVKIKGIE